MPVPHTQPRWQLVSLAINPFGAAACNISGLKSAHRRLQTVLIFRFYNKSLMKILSRVNTKRKEKNKWKKDEWFQISHFYCSFSNNIMAVEGLSCWVLNLDTALQWHHSGRCAGRTAWGEKRQLNEIFVRLKTIPTNDEKKEIMAVEALFWTKGICLPVVRQEQRHFGNDQNLRFTPDWLIGLQGNIAG